MLTTVLSEEQRGCTAQGQSDDWTGREVRAIDGRAYAVSGNYAVEGGTVIRCWPDRGQTYLKLADAGKDKVELPGFFNANKFELAKKATSSK